MRWIARNLPFVDHVALMGLENTGFAIANDAMLWMDPMDYREGLAKAVDHLAAAGVNVSVYNLPKWYCPARSGPMRCSRYQIGRMHLSKNATDVTKRKLQRLLHDRTSALQSRHNCDHFLAKPQIFTAVYHASRGLPGKNEIAHPELFEVAKITTARGEIRLTRIRRMFAFLPAIHRGQKGSADPPYQITRQ